MNAIEVLTNATWTPFATTPMEGTTAPVKKDTLEMDIIAQVCFLTIYNSILYAIVCLEVDEIHWLHVSLNKPSQQGEIIFSQHAVTPL